MGAALFVTYDWLDSDAHHRLFPRKEDKVIAEFICVSWLWCLGCRVLQREANCIATIIGLVPLALEGFELELMKS